MRTGILMTMLLACFAGKSVAQQDSITSRDTIYLRYAIQQVVLPEYEMLLNFIASKTNNPLEVEEIIQNKVSGEPGVRLFNNDKVVIENDLMPGTDTSDLDVIQYLNYFNTTYSKTDNEDIALYFTGISPLKKRDYLFYILHFECSYMGTSSSGGRWDRFNRVAEVIVQHENGTWTPYIQSIRFPRPEDADSLYICTDIVASETDVVKLYKMFQDDDAREKRKEELAIRRLIEEGDEKFEEGSYDQALKLYKDARMKSMTNKQVNDKVSQAKAAIERVRKEKLIKAERENYIQEMKKEAVRLHDNYQFRASKVLCDSILNEYADRDTAMVSLGQKLASLDATLTKIETALETRTKANRKAAIETCEDNILNTSNSRYKAEYYYRLGLVLFTYDSTDTRNIFQALDNAVSKSFKRHQAALLLRMRVFVNENSIMNAIEDITQAINNDPRNPDYYVIRAGLYQRENKKPKAIDDYGRAIQNKTTQEAPYMNKVVLENDESRFGDLVNTATQGIAKFPTACNLYYYRGLALERLARYAEAGEDFRLANACGIAPEKQSKIKRLSAVLDSLAERALSEGKAKEAYGVYSNSVLVDSSERALFGRAASSIRLNWLDSALADMNLLIQRNAAYPDAYYQRGIVHALQGNNQDALYDQGEAVKRNPLNLSAWMAKGNCESKADFHAAAMKSYETAYRIQKNDSSLYRATRAACLAKNAEKAAGFARQKTAHFGVYYYAGLALFQQSRFKESSSLFSKSLRLNATNEDLLWYAALNAEALKDQDAAIGYYERLTNSVFYRDTTQFRSAVCRLRLRRQELCVQAANRLLTYSIQSGVGNLGEVYSWIAYAYLKAGITAQADEYLEKARSVNPGNGVYCYAAGLRRLSKKENAQALELLGKAMGSGLLLPEDFDDEVLLKPLSKSSDYKALHSKYFP